MMAIVVVNREATGSIVVATHDLPLIAQVSGAQMMRLDKGRLADPTGSLRYPPRPQGGTLVLYLAHARGRSEWARG